MLGTVVIFLIVTLVLLFTLLKIISVVLCRWQQEDVLMNEDETRLFIIEEKGAL